ncbi:MAG TPA: SusC/RagA family TonB-linked outer membrane protein [Prolixibacteraceae bacterium]|nr:SusC/RagA family TonB-linked outer membrane protein [Prolixibacteraceae bacterium]
MKRINKSIVLILALVLFCFVEVLAQSGQIIRGRVVDKNDAESLIGVTIAEIDKDNRIVGGTATDVNGDFVYTMRSGANMLRVSVIGYHAREIQPVFNSPMNIQLESSDIQIGAVTVTAERQSRTGLTNVEDRDKASSSVKVDLIEMQEVGVTSAADALQGKISGLDIISASGDPGSGSQIVIRGLSSIGNNKPLVVIDGIPQFKVGSDVNLSSADQEDISNLINVAIQDIKSIEVLKDAGAAAAYGSRGADGVLLIETRSGKMGAVKFEYQYKHSFNVQPPAIPMLNGNEYIMLQLEQLHNARGTFDLPREIAYDRNYEDFYNYSQNTDWLNAITKVGNTQDHYFSLSGGGDKTRYSASFSYVDEGGTTINTNSTRFSTRINLDYILSTKLMYTILFSYTTNDVEGNVKVGDKNIREMAYIKAPNMSIYEYDQFGDLTGEYFNPIKSYQGDGGSYFNPYAVGRLGKNDRKEYSLENSFRLRYIINDWLQFRQTVTFQYTGKKSNVFLPHNALGADWLNWQVNKAEESNEIWSAIRTETQFVFNAPLDVKVHDLSGTLTWATNQESSEWMNLQTNRSPSISLQDPAINAHINWLGSGSGESRDIGGVVNVNYKLLDRYMMQLITRADANSAFGANNRWGVFNGVSVGWRFSSEPFMSGADWLGESKLRFSWGTAGRPPGSPYVRYALYETAGSGTYAGNPAIIPSRVQLDNLKWENVESFNFGFDMNLFKDRLYIETDFYTKTTTDILFGDAWNSNNYYKIPTSSGFSALQFFNGGEMNNRGWELMMNYKIIQKRDIVWTAYFNTSHNENRFTKLPDNFNNEKSTSIANGQYPQRIVEGEPIGSFFGFEYLGVWSRDEDVMAMDAQENPIYDADGKVIPLTYMGTYTFKGGDARYRDQNYDGKIDLNDVVPIGDCNPKFTGGFGTSFQYKDFDISVGFFYRIGFDIINGIAIQTEGMNDKNNQSKAVLRRWRVQGQDELNMLPRAYEGNPANNLGSDRYVESGDFLRLNNLKLGYKVPKHICDALHVKRMNLALSARKLLTFTNYSGQDPEIGQDASDPFWIGVDYARTPPSLMTTVSFSVFF